MEIKNLTDSSEIRGFSDVKPHYYPPRIEVVEITVEKGFADSANDFGDGAW